MELMQLSGRSLTILAVLIFGTAAARGESTPPTTRPASFVFDDHSNQRILDLFNDQTPPIRLSADSVSDPQSNTRVEAVPTPTAMASGLTVLLGLAGYRWVRRIRLG